MTSKTIRPKLLSSENSCQYCKQNLFSELDLMYYFRKLVHFTASFTPYKQSRTAILLLIS